MKRFKIGLFVLLLTLGFILRLYRLDNPIADWHSWRQSDTSSVSREFVKNGFDLLHPRSQNLSPNGSGRENPKGYRFVEFPIYNLFQAGTFSLFDFLTLEEWGRIISIISSLASGVLIFLILRKYVSFMASFFASAFYILLPYNIYFGRVILPEPMVVVSFLAGIYFFDKWIEDKSNLKNQISKIREKNLFFFFLSIFSIAIALLLKPFAIFFVLPIVCLVIQKFGLSALKKWQLWLFAFLSILPFILWRAWMSQYPEGIPANQWLFNEGNIRFKGAFFYWLFADRIGRLILGYWAVALFVLGFLRKIDKEFLFFLSFFASSLLYLTVIAKGNINHDYYQILIVPSLAIFVGLGVEFLLKNAGNLFPKITAYSIILVCSIFTFLFGWYFIRDYFNVNNPAIVEAGRAADKLLPKNAKVLAPYGGDTALLYHINRDGWAFIRGDEEFMMSLGATHMVVVNPTESERKRIERYEVIKSTPEYLIVNIRIKK